MSYKSCLMLVSILLLPLSARAVVFDYQSNNLQLLHGDTFKLGDDTRNIVTFEHAHGNPWGDVFLFVDWIFPDSGDSTYYGEVSPRFSFAKLFNTTLESGLLKDVFLSLNFEKPKGQDVRRLYGLAVDFNVPGFNFFKVNTYVRDNPDLKGDTWQVTWVWNADFRLGQIDFLAEGFADLAGDEGTASKNQLIVPRLLMDMGQPLGFEKRRLYVGVEHSYWHNKYGIDGVTESVPQIQIKLVL